MCAIGAGLLHLTLYHRDQLLQQMLTYPENADLRYDLMAMNRYITAISSGQVYHCLFCEHAFRRSLEEEPVALGILRPSIDAVIDNGRTDVPVLVQGVCANCAAQRTGRLVEAMGDFFRTSLLPNARILRCSEVHPAGSA